MLNNAIELARQQAAAESAKKKAKVSKQAGKAPLTDPLVAEAQRVAPPVNPAPTLPVPTPVSKVPAKKQLTPEGLKARGEELYGQNPGEFDPNQTVRSKRVRSENDALYGLQALKTKLGESEFKKVQKDATGYIMSRIGGYRKGDVRVRPQDPAQVTPESAAMEFLRLYRSGDSAAIRASIDRFKKVRSTQGKADALKESIRQESRYGQVVANPFSNYYLTEGQKRGLASAPGDSMRNIDLNSAAFTAAGEIVRENINTVTGAKAARAWVERMRNDPSEKNWAIGLAMFGAEAYGFLADQLAQAGALPADMAGDIVNIGTNDATAEERARAVLNTALKGAAVVGTVGVLGKAGMEAGAMARAGNFRGAAGAIGRGAAELINPVPMGGGVERPGGSAERLGWAKDRKVVTGGPALDPGASMWPKPKKGTQAARETLRKGGVPPIPKQDAEAARETLRELGAPPLPKETPAVEAAPNADVPKSVSKEVKSVEEVQQGQKQGQGRQEGLLNPKAEGAATAAPVPGGKTVTMTVDGVERTAHLTPEQAAQWDAAEARYKKNIEIQRQVGAIRAKHGSLDKSHESDMRQLGILHAANKRRISGLLTAKEQAAKAEFESKIRKGDTVTLKDGRTGEVVQNPAFGMTKVKVGDAVERVEHASLTKIAADAPQPTPTPKDVPAPKEDGAATAAPGSNRFKGDAQEVVDAYENAIKEGKSLTVATHTRVNWYKQSGSLKASSTGELLVRSRDGWDALTPDAERMVRKQLGVPTSKDWETERSVRSKAAADKYLQAKKDADMADAEKRLNAYNDGIDRLDYIVQNGKTPEGESVTPKDLKAAKSGAKSLRDAREEFLADYPDLAKQYGAQAAAGVPDAPTAPLRGKAKREAMLADGPPDVFSNVKKGGKKGGAIGLNPKALAWYTDYAATYVEDGVDWAKELIKEFGEDIKPHLDQIRDHLVKTGREQGEKPSAPDVPMYKEAQFRLENADPKDPRLDPFDDRYDEAYAGRVAKALGTTADDNLIDILERRQYEAENKRVEREVMAESAKDIADELEDAYKTGGRKQAAFVWRRDGRQKAMQWFLDTKRPVRLIDMAQFDEATRNIVLERVASGEFDGEGRYTMSAAAHKHKNDRYFGPKDSFTWSEIAAGDAGTEFGTQKVFIPDFIIKKIAQEYRGKARRAAGNVEAKVKADMSGVSPNEAADWSTKPRKKQSEGQDLPVGAVSKDATGRASLPGSSAENMQNAGTDAYARGKVDVVSVAKDVVSGTRKFTPEEVAASKAWLNDTRLKMQRLQDENPRTFPNLPTYQKLQSDVDAVLDAADLHAQDWHLQGVARQGMVEGPEFSFDTMWRNVRKANPEAANRPETVQKFQNQSKIIADLEKQLEQAKLNAKLKQAPRPPKAREYGASNRLVTAEAKNAAVERLRARANAIKEGGTVNASSGFDPEILKDAAIWAGYHIEAGVRTVADMVTKAKEDGLELSETEVSEAIRAHLAERDAARKPKQKGGPTLGDLRKEVAQPGIPEAGSPKLQKGKEFGVDILIDDTVGAGIKDPEVGRIRVKLMREQAAARKMIEEERLLAEYKGKNLLGKAWVQIKDINNMRRTMLTSFDNSIPARQGFYTLMTDPVTWGKGFWRSWKGFTKKGLEGVLTEVEAFPRFDEAMNDGVLNLGAFTHVPEEDFLGSKKLAKIPGIKQSEGMADSFVNYTRMARYQKLADAFEVSMGQALSPEQRKLIQSFVNSETGAGYVPSSLKGLSQLMFSARFASSRIENMLVADVWRAQKLGDKKLAKFFAMQYVKRKVAMAALVGIVTAAEQMSGQNRTDVDPRSGEGYGKLRDGKFTYDISAGSSQYTTLVWRLVAKSLDVGGVGLDAPKQSPNMRPLTVAGRMASGNVKTDKGQDAVGYASDFVVNKLSPMPRDIASHFLTPEWKRKRYNSAGEWAAGVAKNQLPISAQNMIDQKNNKVPPPRIMANWIIDALGVGVGGEATRDSGQNRGK